MLEKGMFQYIRSVQVSRNAPAYDRYPLNLPAVKNLGKLDLHPNVSFIVGENGTGKSTLLEAIAVSYGFNPEGVAEALTSQLKPAIQIYIIS